jgi:DNA-binding MarR family transcriptional regulator
MASDLSLPEQPGTPSPLAQVAAGFIPGVREFVTWLVATQQEQRDADIQDFLASLLERLQGITSDVARLRGQVASALDPPQLERPEFIAAVRQATARFAEEHDTAKKEYLLNYLVNFARVRRPDVTLVKVFWQFVRDLSGTHLQVLSAIYGRQAGLAAVDLHHLLPTRPEAVSVAQIERELALQGDLVDLLASNLEGMGLIRRATSSAGPDRSDRLVLRPIGRAFFDFLFGRWEPAKP